MKKVQKNWYEQQSRSKCYFDYRYLKLLKTSVCNYLVNQLTQPSRVL